jgi:hypothetical protein
MVWRGALCVGRLKPWPVVARRLCVAWVRFCVAFGELALGVARCRLPDDEAEDGGLTGCQPPLFHCDHPFELAYPRRTLDRHPARLQGGDIAIDGAWRHFQLRCQGRRSHGTGRGAQHLLGVELAAA